MANNAGHGCVLLGSELANYTVVGKTHPADVTGTCDKLEYYHQGSATGSVAFCFFTASGNDLTTAAGTEVSGLTSSSGDPACETFDGGGVDFTSFSVNSGEYLGAHVQYDQDMDFSNAESGVWYKSGDYIPASGDTFSLDSGSDGCCSQSADITAGGPVVIDPDFLHSSVPGIELTGVGEGDQCLLTTVHNATDKKDAYIKQSKADTQISYVHGWLNMGAIGFTSTGFKTLILTDSSDDECASIEFQYSGGLQWRFNYYSASELKTTAWTTISDQAWYRYQYKYDLTNSAWLVRFGTTAGDTVQYSGSLSANTRTPYTFIAGIFDHGGSSQTDLYSDLMSWGQAWYVNPNFILGVNDSIHAHAADKIPTMVKETTLAVNDCDHAHNAGEPKIITAQTSIKSVDDSSHAHTADKAKIQGHFTLSLSDSDHAHAAGSPKLFWDTTSISNVDDSDHAHTADKVPYFGSTLTVNDSSHAHTADSPDLVVKTLTVADSDHGHTADKIKLTDPGAFTLYIHDTAHAHTADGPSLIALRSILAADSDHGHTVDVPYLVAKRSILAADCTHAHTADKVALAAGGEGGYPRNLLTMGVG